VICNNENSLFKYEKKYGVSFIKKAKRAGMINRNWTHHSPSGMNNDKIPAIIVIMERPEMQIMLKCGSSVLLPVVLFTSWKKRMPHVQQREVIYNHASKVVSIIIS
jgi:hypothetical protein